MIKVVCLHHRLCPIKNVRRVSRLRGAHNARNHLTEIIKTKLRRQLLQFYLNPSNYGLNSPLSPHSNEVRENAKGLLLTKKIFKLRSRYAQKRNDFK